MAKGVLSQLDAVQAIWAWYFQIYLSRDRRSSAKTELNHATGLPVSANALVGGSRAKSGLKLVFEAMVPPRDLAKACTAWLPPPPPGVTEESGWGSEEEHWQVMSYKDETVVCTGCDGKSADPMIQRMAQIARDGLFVPEDVCETCGGEGALPNWTQEEADTVDENELQIKIAVHKLAEEGYFDKRPINERDREMGDLVWEDEAGFTIGFKITYKGWKACEEYIQKRPELKTKLHLLTYAGQDVRDQAPQWAQDEFHHATKA